MSIWLKIDKDGNACLYNKNPKQLDEDDYDGCVKYIDKSTCYFLSENLIGGEISQEDEPIEIGVVAKNRKETFPEMFLRLAGEVK